MSASVGLSHNKFLAKIASDLEKPRGFSVIGRQETEAFLEQQDVGIIWGVGHAFRHSLERDGIRTIRDLKRRDRKDLARRYGAMGDRLWHLARGMDYRAVSARAPVKSLSNETTFSEDTADPTLLDGHLWRLSEKVADRAKAREIAGRVVVLKLKRSDHRLLTRRVSLSDPTQMASRLHTAAKSLLDRAIGEGPFRLIGVGLSDLSDAGAMEASPDLLDPKADLQDRAERATDRIRARFGSDSIVKGRALN